MKPDEIVLRREGGRKRENNTGGKSNEDIFKHICKHHSVSSCTTIIC
jgi:hypothetical protein